MNKNLQAKPFVKWAGGKTQLLEQLSVRLPEEIRKSGVISSYIEPFVGGGAFFFYLRSNFKIKKAYLLDINRELILAYKVIQLKPEALITRLRQLENSYLVHYSRKQGRNSFTI